MSTNSPDFYPEGRDGLESSRVRKKRLSSSTGGDVGGRAGRGVGTGRERRTG